MRRSFAPLAVLALLAALAGGLVHVPTAGASGAAALTDCNLKGHLTRTYSVTELRQALSAMKVEVQEYTDCYDVIRSQLLTQISASRRTGAAGAAAGSGGSFLPAPLIVVLVALALAGGGFAVVAIRRRGHP